MKETEVSERYGWVDVNDILPIDLSYVVICVYRLLRKTIELKLGKHICEGYFSTPDGPFNTKASFLKSTSYKDEDLLAFPYVTYWKPLGPLPVEYKTFHPKDDQTFRFKATPHFTLDIMGSLAPPTEDEHND